MPPNLTARIIRTKSAETPGAQIVLTIEINMSHSINPNQTYEQRRSQAIANGEMEFELAGENFFNELNHQADEIQAQQQFQQQQQQQQASNFSEFEWMIEMEEFDANVKKEMTNKVEQGDDLDDMFYWNVDQGCATQGKGDDGSQNRYGGYQQQQQQQQQPWKYQQNNSQPKKQSGFVNPLAQQQRQQHRQQPSHANIYSNKPQTTRPAYTFNPLARNTERHHQKQQDPMDQLTSALDNVDVRRFNFNPEASSFVPSWLKK